LLDSPTYACANNGLVEIHLGLGQLGLGAPFLGGDKARDPFFRALFRGSGRGDFAELAFGTHLKPLDLAECNVSWVAPVEFALGLQLIQGLLTRAGCLFEVAISFLHVGLSNCRLGVELRNFVPRRFYRSLLL
jgi:hypothetical protein